MCQRLRKVRDRRIIRRRSQKEQEIRTGAMVREAAHRRRRDFHRQVLTQIGKPKQRSPRRTRQGAIVNHRVA